MQKTKTTPDLIPIFALPIYNKTIAHYRIAGGTGSGKLP
jgi:hypothetical protein